MNIYDYQKPLGKIDDDTALRAEFIAVYDTKTKEEAVRFGLLLGAHLLEVTGMEAGEGLSTAFSAMQRWLDKKTNYHEARNIAFSHLYKNAREESDIIKQRFYKTMAQIASIPHVKYHALWATDFAVTLINKMYPADIDEVKKERQAQIEMMKSV